MAERPETRRGRGIRDRGAGRGCRDNQVLSHESLSPGSYPNFSDRRVRTRRKSSQQKLFFSSIKKEELERLFNTKYSEVPISVVDVGPTRALRSRLMGSLTEAEWSCVCRAYTGFFSHGQSHMIRCTVPTSLQPLFTYLQENKRDNINHFGNGAGKLLMFRMLELLPEIKAKIRLATTPDPRHDWCGIDLPSISGVVDVGVKMEGYLER